MRPRRRRLALIVSIPRIVSRLSHGRRRRRRRRRQPLLPLLLLLAEELGDAGVTRHRRLEL